MSEAIGSEPDDGDTRAAEDFVSLMGWSTTPGLLAHVVATTPQIAAVRLAARIALSELLAGQRPHEVAWWRAVGEAWYRAGWTRLAERCVVRARELVTEAAPVDWDDLAALAALSAVGRAEATAAGGPAATWAMRKGFPAARHQRIGRALGDPNSTTARPAATGVRDWVVAELLRTRGEFGAVLAQGFYELGEHRLVVEQVMAEISGGAVVRWRTTHRDHLIWAGRSLVRLGDRTSAYACFALALGADATPTPPPSAEAPDPDPVGNAGVRSMATVADASYALSTADGEYRLFRDGVRLADWLFTHDLQGLFPEFVAGLNTGILRGRSSLLRRQLTWLGRESGWFRPVLEQHIAWSGTVDADVMAQAAAMPAPRHRPDRPVQPPGPDCRAPGDLLESGRPDKWPSAGPTVRSEARRAKGVVRIGFRADGRPAVLDVLPGRRVLLIGPPFGELVLRTVGAQLTSNGWTVLLVQSTRAPAALDDRRWHRLIPAGEPGPEGTTWLARLKVSARLRSAVRDCLARWLHDEGDPALSACLDLVVDRLAADDAAEVFCTDDRAVSIQFACVAVDSRANLRYDRLTDLRRAALLVDQVRAAVTAIGCAVMTTWLEPLSPHTGAGVAVCVAVPPDDPLAAALRLVIYAGSLLEDVVVDRPTSQPAESAAAEDQGSGVEAEFRESPLVVKPHTEPLDDEVLKATIEFAQRTPYDEPTEAVEPAPNESADPSTSAWAGTGIVGGRRRNRRVCLLVDGAIESTWQLVRTWLGESGRPHALVLATREPTLETLAAAPTFDAILAGGLSADRRALLEIALGRPIRDVPDADSLGDTGAVFVRPAATSSRRRASTADARMVIWPSSPIGWDISDR